MSNHLAFGILKVLKNIGSDSSLFDGYYVGIWTVGLMIFAAPIVIVGFEGLKLLVIFGHLFLTSNQNKRRIISGLSFGGRKPRHRRKFGQFELVGLTSQRIDLGLDHDLAPMAR
jgi:hypothetical protein